MAWRETYQHVLDKQNSEAYPDLGWGGVERGEEHLRFTECQRWGHRTPLTSLSSDLDGHIWPHSCLWCSFENPER